MNFNYLDDPIISFDGIPDQEALKQAIIDAFIKSEEELTDQFLERIESEDDPEEKQRLIRLLNGV